jgi:hypothetical protein
MKSNSILKIQTTIMCRECLRVFDLLDNTQAQEWDYGHDCEV